MSLYLAGQINGVCMVNLIMSIGFSVEFTAHITRAFMMATGTRRERARTALRVMFM